MKKENRHFIFDRPEKVTINNLFRKSFHYLIALVYDGVIRILPKVHANEKKYRVCICAIFKNEAPYLQEWIEYNHIVGVDHFYLYNNNSEDDYMTILQPYIEKGLITLIDWPFNHKQMEAYIDGIRRFAKDTKWMGFIDIDEFIVPKSTDSIYDFLKKFEKKRGAVNIYWKLYGTSGLLDRDRSGLVVEDFTVCWNKYCDIGKCFYNTAYSFDEASNRIMELHHRFWANYKGINIPPVNIFDRVCYGNINKVSGSGDFPIQINHYFTKSYCEYVKKCEKGDVYFSINPHDKAYFYEHEMKCTSVDYSAYKYLIALKNVLKEEK